MSFLDTKFVHTLPLNGVAALAVLVLDRYSHVPLEIPLLVVFEADWSLLRPLIPLLSLRHIQQCHPPIRLVLGHSRQPKRHFRQFQSEAILGKSISYHPNRPPLVNHYFEWHHGVVRTWLEYNPILGLYIFICSKIRIPSEIASIHTVQYSTVLDQHPTS
jgi:hypothetical protein